MTENQQILRIIKWVVGGLLLLSLLFGSIGTVGAGEVGIRTRFGAVTGTVNQGLYFKLPLVERVVKMDIQTQKEQVDAVQAASQDLQNVTTNVAINYHLESARAAEVYTNIGSDYASRVIDPAIQESVKANTAKYTAEQLITKREDVREGIIALLTEKMKQFGVLVDAVNITNFSFSADFTNAIESKVTAVQNAEAAKNKLEQVKYEAEQTVAKARAEAQSIQLQSEAANNEKYVSLKALEVQAKAVEKWDGKLPNQMIPGGSVPFINLTK